MFGKIKIGKTAGEFLNVFDINTKWYNRMLKEHTRKL